MKTKWPKQVPILEASDFCKGRLTQGEMHCIVGWSFVAGVVPRTSTIHPTVERALSQAIAETGFDARHLGPHWDLFTRFNDAHRTTLKMVARAWNRAMYLLGYEVGNPEKKTLPRVFK